MSIKYGIAFLLLVGTLGCGVATDKTPPQSAPARAAPNPGASSPTGAPVAASTLALMDSLGLCYDLVHEKTLPAFVKHQPVDFQVAVDTVINDERGLFLGKRLSVGQSFLQWLNDSLLTRAVVADPRVVFGHGIKVGMSKQALATVLGVKPFAADTVSLDSGYLDNHCDFHFKQGALQEVVLVNLPD